MLQRQDDGPDHGDEQHHAGNLEEVDVVRVEHVAERGRVGAHVERRDRVADIGNDVRRQDASAEHHDQFGKQDDPDQRPDRCVFEHAGAQFGEVDVEHHHHEQEEHRHGADIDDEQDHRQEFRTGQQEQPRCVEEGEDEEQHRVHRVARRDHHEGGCHGDKGEDIEKQSLETHERCLFRLFPPDATTVRRHPDRARRVSPARAFNCLSPGTPRTAFWAIDLPVRRVHRNVVREFALPPVAVFEELVLVVVELFPGLGGKFEIRPLDDRIDRAGLLAEPAIDALHHVDVVAHRPARAVVAAWTGLDGDRLGRAYRLAKLARDAALLPVRIPAQRMLPAEARADRPLFEGIVDRRLRPEEITHRQADGLDELLQEKRVGSLCETRHH